MSQELVSVYVPSHFDPYDSYGLIGCELVRHLTRLGLHVNPITPGESSHEYQDEEVARYTSRPILPAVGGIFLGYPTAYSKFGEMANAGPKLAITMFESSKIPEDWVPILNRCDGIIVPSLFCSDVFRDSGVVSPIYVFPLGIGEEYSYRERNLNFPFTYLGFLDRGRRKGGLSVIEAFVDEFGADPRVRLVLKKKPEQGKPKLEFDKEVNPNIEVIYDFLTPSQLSDLYASCHCLVNPHKGEGFGLIPREFAATGGISLTTAWSGTLDNLNMWGWGLDYKMEAADWKGNKTLRGADGLKNQDLGFWAKPVHENVKSQMRTVFEYREQYLKEAIDKSRFVRSFYKWDHFALCVLTVWRAILNGRSRGSQDLTETSRILTY